MDKLIFSDGKIVFEDTPRPLFTCDACNHTFKKRNLLLRHLRKHTGEKPFACDMCDKCFSQKGSLDRHQYIHTGVKRYVCDICEIRFDKRKLLREHQARKQCSKIYECETCQKGFRKEDELAAHNLLHNRKKFSNMNALDVSDNRICNEHFMSKLNLVPVEEKSYICQTCNITFDSEYDFEKHCISHAEKKHKCGDCGRSFIDKNDLLRHQFAHTGEKPEDSALSEMSSCALSINLQSFTTTKIYVCSVCDKHFHDRPSLVRHSIIHTSDKRHECDICKKRFYIRSHLAYHYRIHTAESPTI